MKYLYLISFCFSLMSYSQNSGRVEYSVSTNFAFPYETTGILEFDADNSKYILLAPSKAKKKMTSTFEDQNLTVFMPESKDRPVFYSKLSKNLFISKEKVIHDIYYVKEKLPNINWKIVDEYKLLGDIKCQKAIGYFRGRNYEAWFTSSIALSYGPWKLRGLPGLILEAHDSKNEVFYKAKKITITEIDIIEIPNEKEAINIKEFVTKTIPEKYKEMEAYVNAKAQNRNTSVTLGLPNRFHSREIKYEWEEN